MKKIILTVVVVAVVVVAGVLLLSNQAEKNNKTVSPASQQTTASPTTVQISPTPSSTQSAAVREFTITAQNFSFTPNQIAVNKGDTVKITFKNVDGFHDFTLDAFNIASNKISAGQEQVLTFVADKAGSFPYYCSIGNHRAMGMQGMLTVK